MAKSKCSVSEKQRNKILKSLGFDMKNKTFPAGGSSHFKVEHMGSGRSLSVCKNPAEYTWKKAILGQATKINDEYKMSLHQKSQNRPSASAFVHM